MAFHDQAPGEVVAEVNGARVGEGGWVAQLPLPASSSSRGGSGALRSRPVSGSESPGCAREAREIASPGCGRCRKPLLCSLGRRALQPWLKPTDENTERAAKS